MPCRPSAWRSSSVGWASMRVLRRSMEVAGAAYVGMVDHYRALGLALGTIEVVRQDGSDALDLLLARRVQRGDRDRDGIEPAEKAQDPQAGAEALLGMRAVGEHGYDEPLGARTD